MAKIGPIIPDKTKASGPKNIPTPSPAPKPNVQSAMAADKKATSKIIEQKAVQSLIPGSNVQKGVPPALQKPKQTQTLKVPETAKAPDFSRLPNVTIKPAPKPAPKTVTPPKKDPPKKKTETKKPETKSEVPDAAVVDVDPEPNVPSYDYSAPSSSESAAAVTPPVKSAPIDTVVFIDETFSEELMVDLLFEDIGGQEILSIARNDTVNGQGVIYQPIKNLNILQETYSPARLLRLQETSDKIFANFTIDLAEKIPKVGNGANGVNYYLDLSTGEGIIEFVNLRSDEQVEVQIANAGIIDDVGI